MYDKRVDDIFYVGSTLQQPGKRYSRHMQANNTHNLREAWIIAILEDCSIPLFFPLCYLVTSCEVKVRAIENAIARELQSIGHTALCDSSTLLLHNRIEETNKDRRCDLIEHAIAEYMAMVNEQARVTRFLREIWIH